MNTTEKITLSIAILSFFTAGYTFYSTNFSPPALEAFVGPRVEVHNYPPTHYGFYVPMAVTNTSDQTGVVTRVALAITENNEPERKYYMEWSEFVKWDNERGSWRFDEIAYAQVIPGKDTAQKTAWFKWTKSDDTSNLVFDEGEYEFAFYFWSPGEKEPAIVLKHQVRVAPDMAQSLSLDAGVDMVLGQAALNSRIMSKSELETHLKNP